jgi:hypothetical protein
MKSVHYLMGSVVATLLVGCSSTPVALAPVGPNPFGVESKVSTGGLEVFSSLTEQSDDQNQGNNGDPVWYQHTGYKLYTMHGKLLRRVDNTTGHYDTAPRQVMLPPGRYVVKAQAKPDYWVELPVTIEPGRTTRVHLDDKWKPPSDTPKRELVSLPNDKPVGWRDKSTIQAGIN